MKVATTDVTEINMRATTAGVTIMIEIDIEIENETTIGIGEEGIVVIVTRTIDNINLRRS